MFTYQKTNRYFAQIGAGLEETGAAELLELGAAEATPAFRGVSFSADRQSLYRIVYSTRLCSTVMAPLLRFDCHSTKYLHKTARRIPWQDLMGPETSFVVAANVSGGHIRHSHYAALCLKDAIVDHFRDATGQRPSVDKEDPDLRLNLFIANNKATISLDLGGGSLHRRGYRREAVAAPMQETLAAAIIRLSGWDGSRPLVDPLCGSGTLLAEALMHACRVPAGFLRREFGFERLPDFEPDLWRGLRNSLDSAIEPLAAGLISGSDADRAAVAAARTNCNLLPGGEGIRIEKCRFQDRPASPDSVIVANPPYGLRLGNRDETLALMTELGNFLKQRCTGASAFLYFGDRELIKHLGLRPAWKKPLANGGLDGLLAKYELY